MSSFEINKIAASVLLALIVAWTSGLLANKLIEPKALSKSAVAIANVGAQPEAAAPAGGSQAAGPEPISPLLASADPKAGQDDVKKCAACHTFDKGGPNRVGPNLWGVIGSKVAEDRGGYAFSDALKKKGGTWTVDALNEWLFKPQAFAKGTKMTFVGLPKPKDRADTIAYLNQQSDSPQQLAGK
jgi:cytochrome c